VPAGPAVELPLEVVGLLVGRGLGREFLLRVAQGVGFLGAEALQLGGDALLDVELEGLQAGDVGLGVGKLWLGGRVGDG
jgi:hypothetical protein